MKLRTLLLCIFGVTGFLLTLLVANTYRGKQELIKIDLEEQRKFDSFQLADELRQSSDDLTRMARSYVATGEKKYEKFYHRILDIRNGKAVRPSDYAGVYWDLVTAEEPPVPQGQETPPIALEKMFLDAGFTLEEFALLKTAQNRSDRLARLEMVAFHAIRGEFDDGTGTFGLRKEPDPQLALRILFDQEYHNRKAEIMEPIRDFTRKVEQRTEETTDKLERDSVGISLQNLGLVGLTLLVLAVSYFLISRLVLSPVRKIALAVEKMERGEYEEIQLEQSTQEMMTLARTFNHMSKVVREREKKKDLDFKELGSRALSLDEERNRAEKLLLNVLPAAIVERLQRGEEVVAETFPEVTVFFADIVGFTKLATTLGPKSVANMLNDIFDLFDSLAEKHKLEKIKTIGDCYMAVAGVPDRSPTHAQQMADFALEVLAALEVQNREKSRDVQMRVGIHSGTVAAGIIGRKKFAYDLWGDVVNITSRLESTAAAMKIHASESVHTRLQDEYIFEPRGEIELRNRGNLRTYYLVGKKAE